MKFTELGIERPDIEGYLGHLHIPLSDSRQRDLCQELQSVPWNRKWETE